MRHGGFQEVVAAKEMKSSETPPPGEELPRAFHVSSTKKRDFSSLLLPRCLECVTDTVGSMRIFRLLNE